MQKCLLVSVGSMVTAVTADRDGDTISARVATVPQAIPAVQCILQAFRSGIAELAR